MDKCLRLPLLFFLFHAPHLLLGLNNGVAKTPPMGFNTYYAHMSSESGMLSAANWLTSTGLSQLGYIYVNCDAGWAGSSRDPTTQRQTFSSAFPDGFDYVCTKLHALDLKCGIYSALSSVQCGNAPGSLFFENIDAGAYKDWGVDYLKYDNCAEYAYDWTVRTAAMRDALNRTGRAIVFSYEPFAISNFKEAPKMGNLARTTKDISASWASIIERIDLNDKWGDLAGPGYWNDPDMLQVGNGLAFAETRSQFVLWAVMKSPLILSPNNLNVSSQELSLISNQELIAINQDSLGKQGRKLSIDGNPVPYPVGADTCQSGVVSQQFTVTKNSISSNSYTIKNAKGCLSVFNKLPALLPCNGSDPNQAWIFNRGWETLSEIVNYAVNRSGSGAMAALGIANSTLYTAAHGTSDPVLPDAAYGINTVNFQTLTPEPPCTSRSCEDYAPWQTWYYDPVDQLVRFSMYVASINHCFEGDCYDLTHHWPTTTHWCLSAMDSIANTGTPAGTVEVWGGPLSSGGYVMALMNRGSSAANIKASWSMLGVSGVGDTTCFSVRDLVNKKDLGNFTGSYTMDGIASHDTGAIRLTKC